MIGSFSFMLLLRSVFAVLWTLVHEAVCLFVYILVCLFACLID